MHEFTPETQALLNERPTCAHCRTAFLTYRALEVHVYRAHTLPEFAAIDDRPEWIRRAQDRRLPARVSYR